MKRKKGRTKAVWVILAVCLFALMFVPSAYAGTIVVDNSGACVSGSGQPDPYTATYCKIQDAIDDALVGDLVQVATGIYTEKLDLMTDNVTVAGSGEAVTIIDGPASNDYHFDIRANNVTVRDFTLLGDITPYASAYGLKIAGDAGVRKGNITVQNVTVDGTYKSGVDLNGIDIANLTNVTVQNVVYGVGVALTDVDDATLTTITTANNAWGGVAVYTLGNYFPDGPSENISVMSLNASEAVPLYWEVGCVGAMCTPFPITNFTAPQFTHAVRNAVYPNYTWFQYDEAAAIDGALAVLPTPSDSIVNEFSGSPGVFGDFIVGSNGSGEMSIQTAVDAAVATETVWVRDGTYVENVYIDKDITLTGQGSAAVVEAPAAIPTCFSTSTAKHPVICVEDTADATVEYLTIDGAGKGNGNVQFMGVAFHNAGGTLANSTITGIRDTPFSGSQHGVAVYSWQHVGGPYSLAVTDNVITDFQKNAMALNANDTTAMDVFIDGNTIVGAGPTTVTAQNGVQLWGALIDGDISNNVISGIGYDNTNNPTKWVASSILNYLTGVVDITGNQVFGGHVGIYSIEGAGTLAFNDLTIEKIGVSAYGIIATDPPEAVPSPYAVEPAGAQTNGGGGRAPLPVFVNNNFVIFSGPDKSNTYGIEADAGYGVDDLDILADFNVVRGFDVGFEFYECQSGCAAGIFSTLIVANNCIENNNIGLRSNVTVAAGNPLLAESNWWGAVGGPAGGGDPVVGNVDFDPWLFASNCALLTPGDWQNLTTGQYYPTLQLAADGASPGDEIIATGFGPYPGAVITTPGVVINLNGATLNGASPAVTVSAANVTLMNGTLAGPGPSSTDPGVLLTPGGNNLIIDDMEITGWVDGVRLDDAASFTVTSFKLVNSYVHGNSGAGLAIGANAALNGVITIEGNLFKANTGGGVVNGNGVDVDATYNSWGCDTGPGTGTCDSAGVNVLYDPWTFAEMALDMAPTADATTVNVFEGQSFDVDLKVDAVNLTGLSFDFTFDSSMLTLNSVTIAGLWSGSCGPVAGAAADQVYYQCNLLPPPTPTGYTQAGSVVATINFTAENNGGLVDPGPWNTYLDLNEITSSTGSVGGAKVFVNNAGYGAVETRALINDADDGEVVIIPTGNFTGFVDLQGRTDDSGGVLQVYDVSLRGAATALAQGTSDSSGSYTTSGLAGAFLQLTSTYWLYLDAPLYLPTTASVDLFFGHSAVLTNRPLTPLNALVLLGGDATDDNFINILDATCIGTDFGTSNNTCSSGNSDVNGDGTVNILDLTLMGGNWQSAFSAWTP